MHICWFLEQDKNTPKLFKENVRLIYSTSTEPSPIDLSQGKGFSHICVNVAPFY